MNIKVLTNTVEDNWSSETYRNVNAETLANLKATLFYRTGGDLYSYAILDLDTNLMLDYCES
jgi:hypothetical protein